MIRAGGRRLWLRVPQLDALSNDGDVLDALKSLALSSPRADLRVLFDDAGHAVKTGHGLIHLGRRLRRRRRLLGMTQQDLASQVGVRFQQIQKYECGANRITASRLYELAKAMNVSVQYFFDGIPAADAPDAANDAERMEGDILSQKETLELVRAYYRLGERPRKRLLELAKALEGDTSSTGVA